MKPILHGMKTLEGGEIMTKVPTAEVNVPALVNFLESNLEAAAVPKEWTDRYEKIKEIYLTVFTLGELPEAVIEKTDNEILEIAFEHIEDEIEFAMYKPHSTHQRDYFYEFCRSLGVEKQAASLKEYLDDECDFI